ncbi:MAG: hypothetical protein ACR2PW_05315 [Gammaproteobacteria bacterium]
MKIAIDFGISTNDLVIQTGEQLNTEQLQYYNFPSSQPASTEYLELLLKQTGVDLDRISHIAVTGGHSARIADRWRDLPITKVNEIDAQGAACAVLEPASADWQKPLLIVNTGSGTTCVLVSDKGTLHVGGTAMGGGTLVGLCSLLLNTKDPEEIAQLAESGQSQSVDLTIHDVASNPVGTLPPDATAVNFGQLIHQSPTLSRQDIAAGLVNLVGQSIALTALSAALMTDAKTICVIGRTSSLKAIRHSMERVFSLPWGKKQPIIFPRHAGSASALGCLSLSNG